MLWGSPSLIFDGYWGAVSSQIKLLGCEADHLPPSTTKLKNGWSIPPLIHMPEWNAWGQLLLKMKKPVYIVLFRPSMSDNMGLQ